MQFNVCRERKDWVAKLRTSSLILFQTVLPFPDDSSIYHMQGICGSDTGLERKTVSLCTARSHPHHLLVQILIRREIAPGGHDIMSLDTQLEVTNCDLKI